MKRLALVVLLAGCGPGVDLSGTYEGDLTTTTPCSGVQPSTAKTTWTITSHQTGLRLSPGVADCASLALDSSGSKATVKPVMCTGNGSTTFATEVVSGGLELGSDGKSLTFLLNERFDIFVGPKRTCDFKIAGTLKKL